jgi:hypothetical protein
METILKHKKKIIVLVLVILIVVGSSGMFSSKTLSNDPLAMVDLSMKMESDLQLQDVMISEVVGNVLEIRVKDPSVLKEKLDVGTAYIFGYVEPSIGKNIKTVRVIYTVNNFDVSLFETSLSDISDWTSKKIDDTAFAQKIKFVNLAKK